MWEASMLPRLVLPVVLALGACVETPDITRATVDMSYANGSGLGFENSGLLLPGQLYIWDTEANTLAQIDVLALPDPVFGPRTDLVASSTSGFVLNVSGPIPGALDDLSADLGRQLVFSAKGAARQSFRDPLAALTRYARSRHEDGVDIDALLGTREDNHRLVLIDSVLRVQERSAQIGNAEADAGNLDVTVAGVSVRLRVIAGRQVACRATDPAVATESLPACFFSVRVIDPFYPGPETALQWRPVAYDAARLAAAFRKL